MSTPSISIITVTYNAEQFLEKTIQSVINQTYKAIEYIIVDGKSKDKTIDIIEKYEGKIDRWISEPDKGLYDAMNKGLCLANGDFIIFMNAGDLFYDKEIIKQVFHTYTPDTDVLYGKTILIDEAYKELGLRSKLTTRKLPKNLHWRSLKYGMVVCHQSIFVRRSIAIKSPYLIKNLSADIDWTINVLKNSNKTINSGLVVSKFMIGGISKQKQWQSLKDRFAVMQKHYGLFPTLIAHFLILLRSIKFQIVNLNQPKYS